MDKVRGFARRHGLIVYFVLAYALTWWVYPLLSVSVYLGFFGLIGPALAAIITSALADGRAGVRALLGRLALWRVSPLWYAVALGLPVLVSLIPALFDLPVDLPSGLKLNPIGAISVVLFVLVVGEELGWRGYALPRLLERYSPLAASLILGVVWAFWHAPTFLIPGTPQYGIPMLAYLIYVVSLSVVFTWLYLHTGGSALLATILHGAIDILGFKDPSGAQNWPVIAAAYAVTAIILIAISGAAAFVKAPADFPG